MHNNHNKNHAVARTLRNASVNFDRYGVCRQLFSLDTRGSWQFQGISFAVDPRCWGSADSKHPRLSKHEIIFEEFQPVWSYLIVTYSDSLWLFCSMAEDKFC